MIHRSANSAVRPAVVNRSVRGSVRPVAFLNLNLFGTTQTRKMSLEEKKSELLSYVEPLKRGLMATPEQQQRVEEMASALERLNPTKKPLASPLLNGRWQLRYTTSQSILGTSKPFFLRPSGPIYQFLDGPNLKAKNQESAPLFNSVTADLTPLTSSKVKVQFKTFKLLNLISVTAPPTAIGELDVTYLDKDLRISRGDKGNLFVLTQDDPDATITP